MSAVVESDKSKYPTLDLWLALLAGEQVWVDAEDDPSTGERTAALVALFAATFIAVLVWGIVSTQLGPLETNVMTSSDGRLIGVASATTIAVAFLAVHPFRLVIGRRGRPASFQISVAWRSATYLLLIVAVAASLPRIRALGAWPVGVLGGADAALTIWALGIRPRPRFWFRRFLFSPLHFGVLGGLLGSFLVLASDSRTRTLIGLYIAMWVGLLAAILTLLFLDSLQVQLDTQRKQDRVEVIASERAHRAHWIHDDVLSEVQIASLRISSGTSSPTEILNELRELDHRLRLRQLDETFGAGEVHIYDVIQPHLRRVQALKVELSSVPTHEITKRCTSESDGRLLGRALAVLTSNSVNAGATEIAVDLLPVQGSHDVILRVSDNAGGFDVEAIPYGRGLSTLIRDVGPGRLERIANADGSVVSVRLSAAPVTKSKDSSS